MVNKSKRKLLTAAAVTAATSGLVSGFPAIAQQRDLKVVLIAPLSGPWARNGDLMRKGAELAIEDINNSGGVKSMGCAKMRLVTIDAGDTVQRAKNAAERMI